MKISAKKYAVALYELVSDADAAQVKKYLQQFVATLNRNGDIKRADDIIRAFSELCDERSNSASGTLVVAHKPDAALLKEIQKEIARLLDKAKVTLTTEVDEWLIGGFRAIFPDHIIDASIQGRLRSLKQDLTQ